MSEVRYLLIPVTLLLFQGVTGCHKPVAQQQTAVVATGADGESGGTEPTDTAPPEKYATLPPGAFQDEASGDAGGATDQPGDASAGTGGETTDTKSTAPPKPDSGLVPNAGELALTGVRVGMGTPEIRGRYPTDSGWTFDERFIPETETGVVIAKPNDINARATEMTMLQDGVAVAFLRVVKEDSEAYRNSVGELSQSFGTPQAAPPDWARQFKIFASFHLAANEQSRFWANPGKQQVLTAGHSPTDAETIYMLLDLPRTEAVETAMDEAKLSLPQEAPVDPGWTPPPGAEVH